MFCFVGLAIALGLGLIGWDLCGGWCLWLGISCYFWMSRFDLLVCGGIDFGGFSGVFGVDV